MSESPAASHSAETIGTADLPLSCPRPDGRLWDAHPRVYLPIEPGQTVICPYCGTAYTLAATEPPEE